MKFYYSSGIIYDTIELYETDKIYNDLVMRLKQPYNCINIDHKNIVNPYEMIITADFILFNMDKCEINLFDNININENEIIVSIKYNYWCGVITKNDKYYVKLKSSDEYISICKKYLTHNPISFKYINSNAQTYELCKLIIEIEPLMLEYIINKKEELCERAVKLDGRTLKFVNNITYELCTYAIQSKIFINFNQGNILTELTELVSLMYDKHKNILKYLISIKSDYIMYIEEKYISDEICKYAIDKDYNAIHIIAYMKNINENICKYAIDKNSRALNFINNYSLKNTFPLKEQYEDICIYAIEKHDDKNLIRSINPSYITEKMCKIQVKLHGLKFLYERFITEELCIIAINKSIKEYSMIPRKLKTAKLLRLALQLAVCEEEKQYLFDCHYTNSDDSDNDYDYY
jgi:hypothetical protein